MADLLARIDELRRAGPKVMGDSQWILSGDRVFLVKKQDNVRHWIFRGLLLLLFAWGAAYCTPPWFFDSVLVPLQVFSAIVVLFSLNGLLHLLFSGDRIKLNWRRPAISQVGNYALVVPFDEIVCIIGVPGDDTLEVAPEILGVRRDGHTFELPWLFGVMSQQRNVAAYGFVLDRPGLFFAGPQRPANIGRLAPTNLDSLQAAGAERLGPYAWRDDGDELSESGPALHTATRKDGRN